MKKLFLFLCLFLVAVSFNSCNNNDDGDDEDIVIIDKIIGKWKFSEMWYNNTPITLTDCERMMTLEFYDNGTYKEKDFEDAEFQGNCKPLETVFGTWENLGNSNYKISEIGIPSVKITFITNKMTVEFTEIIEGETISAKYILIKVNS